MTVVFDPVVRRNRCAECRRVVASGQRVCVCGAELARVTRVYWGCTTGGGCKHGFGGDEADFSRWVAICPDCGGDLTEITTSRHVESGGPPQ